MKYGTNIDKETKRVNFGYLTFDTGKKIILDSKECKEFEDRLKLAKAEGRIEREANAEI